MFDIKTVATFVAWLIVIFGARDLYRLTEYLNSRFGPIQGSLLLSAIIVPILGLIIAIMVWNLLPD